MAAKRTRPFEVRVRKQIDRLREGGYERLEAEIAEKRREWFQNRGTRVVDRPSPRDGYELFLREYLGLSEEQVPILSETEHEIVWQSMNDCPTLEACKELDLDTRRVCRRVFEKSTQTLISQLDPQLRFWRSYEEIRPHVTYCKEGIVRIDFERLMRLALQEAEVSLSEGNKGYGAVLVLGNRLLAAAHDTAVTDRDPSLHAEVRAIRQAVRELGDPDLCGAVLVSTCEPCPMCASLAAWANLTTLVYGASIADTAQLGKSRILISCREVVDKAPVSMEIIGGVLRQECLALYRDRRSRLL